MTQIQLALGEHIKNIEKRLEYESSASLFDLFPDSFMSTYTNHKNAFDFFKSINCDITSQKDLEKLNNSIEFDEAIRTQSNFESWEDMVETAYNLLINQN